MFLATLSLLGAESAREEKTVWDGEDPEDGIADQSFRLLALEVQMD